MRRRTGLHTVSKQTGVSLCYNTHTKQKFKYLLSVRVVGHASVPVICFLR
jgi:hypothetical protein